MENFDPLEGAMMEEREELMAAAGAGGESVFRTAHFLTATNKSRHFDAFPLSPNTTTASPPKVDYLAWNDPPPEEWKRWVRRLEPVYGEIWKITGIYGAILASTYNVVKCSGAQNLMLKLAENWFPKTNTFLFPWGECTVTLEDVMILGGFPVLGELVSRPCISDEMLRLERKLSDEQLRIDPRSPEAWLDHFMGGGSEKLEHEAFLVFWLARYVFQNPYSLIDTDLFLIGINMSRGIRIALGPAVLCSIYRDLRFLKTAPSMRLSGDDSLLLCSPLGIVKVWAWERFPRLCPEPKPLQPGEPRIARWSGLSPNVWLAFDIAQVLYSSGQDFQWRPYVGILTNWDSQKLYNESDGYVMAGSGMDCDVIQALIRCWRNAELVEFDCMEQYLPHRVGMQFGFDQDLPGLVVRPSLKDEFPDKAWLHYNRPVKDTKIYVPARLSTSNVTKRYRDIWAGAEEMGDHNPNPVLQNVQGQMDEEDPPFPPGFGPDAVYSRDDAAMEVDGNGDGSSELDFESGPSETGSSFCDSTSNADEREASSILSSTSNSGSSKSG